MRKVIRCTMSRLGNHILGYPSLPRSDSDITIGLVGASNEDSQFSVMRRVKDVTNRIAVNVIDGHDPKQQGE